MKNKGPDRVVDGGDERAHNQESKVLKEVTLSSLSVIQFEPVSIGELLGEVAIAGVRVAELGRLFLSREGFAMDLIELLHELSVEDLDASAHGHGVDRDHVL